MISVLIVDDHNIVRFAFRKILANANDISVVGDAESGEEAIRLIREFKPDVVLMDIQMPGMSGLEATQKLLRVYPNIKIIALTAHEEDPFPSTFVSAGAAGYLTKNTNIDELISAIHSVHAGHPYITPSVAHHLATLRSRKAPQSPFADLSKRELQVMWMILKGDKTKDIAEKINLSIKTISTYRTRIFEKLEIKNDVELAQLAMRYSILDNTHLPK